MGRNGPKKKEEKLFCWKFLKKLHGQNIIAHIIVHKNESAAVAAKKRRYLIFQKTLANPGTFGLNGLGPHENM